MFTYATSAADRENVRDPGLNDKMILKTLNRCGGKIFSKSHFEDEQNFLRYKVWCTLTALGSPARGCCRGWIYEVKLSRQFAKFEISSSAVHVDRRSSRESDQKVSLSETLSETFGYGQGKFMSSWSLFLPV